MIYLTKEGESAFQVEKHFRIPADVTHIDLIGWGKWVKLIDDEERGRSSYPGKLEISTEEPTKEENQELFEFISWHGLLAV